MPHGRARRQLSRGVEDAAGSTPTRLHRRRHARRPRSRPGPRSRRRARRLRARPPAGPPRAGRTRDGLLPLQQRRGRGARGTGRARARARRDRRLRRPPRQRHRGDLPRRRQRPLRLPPPVAVLSGHRAARTTRRETTLNIPLPAGSGDEDYLRRSRRSSSRRSAHSRRSSCSSRPASTRTTDDPLAHMRVSENGFRELARRCAAMARPGRGGARGRLRPRDAAGPRRRGARRLRVVEPENRRPPSGGRPLPLNVRHPPSCQSNSSAWFHHR